MLNVLQAQRNNNQSAAFSKVAFLDRQSRGCISFLDHCTSLQFCVSVDQFFRKLNVLLNMYEIPTLDYYKVHHVSIASLLHDVFRMTDHESTSWCSKLVFKKFTSPQNKTKRGLVWFSSVKINQIRANTILCLVLLCRYL